MTFNKDTFEQALRDNKIVRYQKHFEAVVKSYLEIDNKALRIHDAKDCNEVHGLFTKDYTDELSMIDINNPDFKNTSKVHDWRNSVPYDWQNNWEQFTERERQIIAVMAQGQADNEEWD